MRKSVVLAAMLLPLTAACATVNPAEPATAIHQLGEVSKITGTMTYRERIALPPGSIAIVTLEDISRADAKATVIDEQRYSLANTSLPFAYELELPNRSMAENARYAVRGQIRAADGTLLFTTDTVHPVMRRPVDQNLGEIVMVSARR